MRRNKLGIDLDHRAGLGKMEDKGKLFELEICIRTLRAGKGIRLSPITLKVEQSRKHKKLITARERSPFPGSREQAHKIAVAYKSS